VTVPLAAAVLGITFCVGDVIVDPLDVRFVAFTNIPMVCKDAMLFSLVRT
jgi:hypothetical protein